jgi:hypothetical protein
MFKLWTPNCSLIQYVYKYMCMYIYIHIHVYIYIYMQCVCALRCCRRFFFSGNMIFLGLLCHVCACVCYVAAGGFFFRKKRCPGNYLPPVRLSVHPSVCASVRPSVRPTGRPTDHPSVRRPTNGGVWGGVAPSGENNTVQII